jgi:hypothetical protein
MKEYGKNDKRISFMDTDKRSADLLISLKNDSITKAKFFRAIVTGYLEKDAAIIDFLERYKKKSGVQSARQATIVKKSIEKGKESIRKFGLEDGEIENIFDILEKEHPEL